tara:strand:+ start:889 stop:1062 length:174 start_codon:yes stop_codon:yes gene_type:complete
MKTTQKKSIRFFNTQIFSQLNWQPNETVHYEMEFDKSNTPISIILTPEDTNRTGQKS